MKYQINKKYIMKKIEEIFLQKRINGCIIFKEEQISYVELQNKLKA